VEKDTFKITLELDDGRRISFEHLEHNRQQEFQREGVKLKLSGDKCLKMQCAGGEHVIKSIEYDFSIKMKNYYSVILPESGRWFFNSLRMVTFWRNFRTFDSAVNDVKLPLMILTGKDMYTGTAVGVIGENYETRFSLLEPESNRALNVHTGHITFQMKRGTNEYPIPRNTVKDGYITEYIYYADYLCDNRKPWLLTMREFTDFQREYFDLRDIGVRKSMYPVWCTWADWHSNDINEEMILENIEIGLANGIKNYIIDDGWFGPGLDNDYSIPLNIGDWEPDTQKIPDMKQLVDRIHDKGANAIIWCAPHAVAEGAACFSERRHLLIANESGEPFLNPTQFYSLCFMNEESREIMAGICAKFISKWGFDGAKYDLFNWVPNVRCENPNHTHNVDSMIEGLNKTLELIEEKTRALKKDYIVELKQNYGTPFMSRWGTMMRAGDAPYDPESNFLRTMHIQSYTPYSLNDYQTFTEYDSPEDIAVAILKMLAAGIPAYSVNFKRLSRKQNEVVSCLNDWYCKHIDLFMKYRIPCEANNHLLRIPNDDFNIFFMVNESTPVEQLNSGDIIFNASYHKSIVLKTEKRSFEITEFDCYGNIVFESTTESGRLWETVKVLPGGRLVLNEKRA